MEVSVGLMAHVQPPLIYFLGSDKGSAKKFGRATTIVTLPKAVAERSASEQRKRKNESLVTSGCAVVIWSKNTARKRYAALF